MLLDSWNRTSMHKNQARQESNQALLARVKKEMDKPRMAASTREETVNQTKVPERVKLPWPNTGATVKTCWRRPSAGRCSRGAENNGKAHQGRSGWDIRSALRFSQAAQGAAGERFARAQRGCALPSGERRYRSRTSSGVEADTGYRQAIRCRTATVQVTRTRHVLAIYEIEATRVEFFSGPKTEL